MFISIIYIFYHGHAHFVQILYLKLVSNNNAILRGDQNFQGRIVLAGCFWGDQNFQGRTNFTRKYGPGDHFFQQKFWSSDQFFQDQNSSDSTNPRPILIPNCCFRNGGAVRMTLVKKIAQFRLLILFLSGDNLMKGNLAPERVALALLYVLALTLQWVYVADSSTTKLCTVCGGLKIA